MIHASTAEQVRRYIALLEGVEEIIPPDQALEADLDDDDAQLARERRVVGLIRTVFGRIGLEIATDVRTPISYDETPDREAEVVLEDDHRGVSLDLLSRLQQSGLGSDFRLRPQDPFIVVTFRVTPEIDTAELA